MITCEEAVVLGMVTRKIVVGQEGFVLERVVGRLPGFGHSV